MILVVIFENSDFLAWPELFRLFPQDFNQTIAFRLL